MKDVPETLLAAMLAHPEENEPRLAIADWFEREGRRTRAALVRVQCTSGAASSTEEAYRLIEALRAEGETVGTVSFERGFATTVFATWDRVTPAALAGFTAREPLLRRLLLGLKGVEATEDVVIGLRLVPPRIRELVLVDAINRDDETPVYYRCCATARALAESARPGDVTELFFLGCGVDGICAGAVLDAARSWELDALGFLDGRLSQQRGAAVLAHAPAVPLLTRLGLRENGLRAPDVATVLAGSSFPSLTDLLLGGNPLGDPGAQVLADAGRSLRSLDLSATGLSDEGAHLLANSAVLSTLEELDVARNAIGDLGKKKLRDRFGDRVRC